MLRRPDEDAPVDREQESGPRVGFDQREAAAAIQEAWPFAAQHEQRQHRGHRPHHPLRQRHITAEMADLLPIHRQHAPQPEGNDSAQHGIGGWTWLAHAVFGLRLERISTAATMPSAALIVHKITG
jgi:hypothetical protein